MSDHANGVQRLTGWGRTTVGRSEVLAPGNVADLGDLLTRRPLARGVLARGLGRSYGDAACNDGGVVVSRLCPDAPLQVRAEQGTVTASAGTSLARLLDAVVPQGWTLPVLPGTRHVTVGGAIAADIHGKGHHRDSSFGAWVEQLDLLDGTGVVRRLTPTDDAASFWATVGGMGLTGIIVAATLRLAPIETGWMRVTTTRVHDLDDLLAKFDHNPAPRYQVAWLDCLAPRDRRYRAIVDEGDHAKAADLAERPGTRTFPGAPRCVPAPALPVSPLRPASIRAMNAMRWHRASRPARPLVPLSNFFFPLDVVSGWNRLYGKRGLVQYQFVVPLQARQLVREVLDQFVLADLPPFLAVLKRMGTATPAPLSFPMRGWTLAVDVPGDGALDQLLPRLDAQVAEAGGRIYFAKDSRASASTVAAMYPELERWHCARDRLDPHRRMASDLGRRTGLC